MNNSFGDSFNQRIKELCEKYESVKDDEDDIIDLENLQVTSDFGKLKDMKRLEIRSIYLKKYRRQKNLMIQKYNYLGYDELYNGLFSNSFNDIYAFLKKTNKI